jgi:NTE family protein
MEGDDTMLIQPDSQLSPRAAAGEPHRKLAFVLSGGGPRGALQVGALRALLEADIRPDMIVGTSIGAINGAFIARFGFNEDAIERLIAVWDDAANGEFAPADFIRAMIRSLIPRMNNHGYLEQARAFYARHGITPDLRFRDLTGPELYIIAADINHHRAVIFGEDPDDLVLDSMLASAAIPPWLPPLKLAGGLMVDGGAVSDLPIEPALRHGATEIIALDLFHPQPPDEPVQGFTGILNRVLTTMENRHIELELELARLQGVPVHRWKLLYEQRIPMWDLSHTHNLIHLGYDMAKTYLAQTPLEPPQEAFQPPAPAVLPWQARLAAFWEEVRARWGPRRPG